MLQFAMKYFLKALWNFYRASRSRWTMFIVYLFAFSLIFCMCSPPIILDFSPCFLSPAFTALIIAKRPTPCSS